MISLNKINRFMYLCKFSFGGMFMKISRPNLKVVKTFRLHICFQHLTGHSVSWKKFTTSLTVILFCVFFFLKCEMHFYFKYAFICTSIKFSYVIFISRGRDGVKFKSEIWKFCLRIMQTGNKRGTGGINFF